MKQPLWCQSTALEHSMSCLAEPCWKGSRLWRVAIQRCLLCSNSTGQLPHTSGKIKKELHTQSCKQREESKVIHSCRLSSLLVNIQHSRLCSPSCKMANVFSRFWMMCTSCAHLPVSTRFMRFCSASSSPTLPFEFITGRLKCGTGEVLLHLALRCCRRWQECTTRTLLCGEATPLCAVRTKASGFWAHHWDTQIMFASSCLHCLRNTTSCSRRSSPFKISSVLGCSFCIVAALGQTTS